MKESMEGKCTANTVDTEEPDCDELSMSTQRT